MSAASGVSSARPPVIVIGMHRSGTTLLAELLAALGLFTGWRMAPNHEASFFNRYNAWLLAAAGGRWDTPGAFDHLLADEAGRRLAVDYLRGRLSGPAAIEFLGPRRLLRWRSVTAIGEPWGWKDPRTTVTLPVWLDLFPRARVLHMVRNGVDVADSLTRRQQGGFELGRARFERYRRLFAVVPKRGWFGTSPRLSRRSEGFRLWEEYLACADRFTSGLGDRLLTMRYETLLAEPAAELARAAAFSGLTADAATVAAATSRVRPERSFAFRDDPELRALWEANRGSPWMRRFGYDDLPGRDGPAGAPAGGGGGPA